MPVMSHKFSIKTASLFASLGVVAAFALVSPIKQAGAEAKTVDCATVKDKEVNAFCVAVSGKEVSIKKAMKDAQKDYNTKNGTEWECKTCHATANGGELTGAAKDNWPKLKPLFDTAAKAILAKNNEKK